MEDLMVMDDAGDNDGDNDNDDDDDDDDNITDSGEKEELCGERDERVLWRGEPGRGEPGCKHAYHDYDEYYVIIMMITMIMMVMMMKIMINGMEMQAEHTSSPKSSESRASQDER